MNKSVWSLALLASCAIAHPASAELVLQSSDIHQGQMMPKAQEFQGFGCAGDNRSPALSWSGAPEGTKAYALLVHDADAPTGSGWWHWQLINIPAEVTSLAAGAGADGAELPKGSQSMRNDYGVYGFGGACPPPGHGVHHYRFTLYALPAPLDLPKDASAALTGYMVNGSALASSTIEALYQR
jgi:Raf kinase inhibitor-like YbhB/YbcL family protein